MIIVIIHTLTLTEPLVFTKKNNNICTDLLLFPLIVFFFFFSYVVQIPGLRDRHLLVSGFHKSQTLTSPLLYRPVCDLKF